MKATINLLDSDLMSEFYRAADAGYLALKFLVEGRYTQVGPFEIAEARDGEAVAEELFDLTNNPDRELERERVYGRGRSLSVGDVVFVNSKDMYLCMSTGWAKL